MVQAPKRSVGTKDRYLVFQNRDSNVLKKKYVSHESDRSQSGIDALRQRVNTGVATVDGARIRKAHAAPIRQAPQHEGRQQYDVEPGETREQIGTPRPAAGFFGADH